MAVVALAAVKDDSPGYIVCGVGAEAGGGLLVAKKTLQISE